MSSVKASVASTHPAFQNQDTLTGALDRACKKIAPLWPLESFVAVNPYLGFTPHSFEQTAAYLSEVAGFES
ncbi:MAG: putative inorganic carbon transporter subunit DabA, partial [Cyclonatronaceae bacterium]